MTSQQAASRWRPWRGLRFGAAVAALGVFLPVVSGAEPAPPLREASLRLLYADSMFLTVNRNDALAAIKVWVETLGRRRGFALTVDTAFYEQVEEAQARVRDGAVEMIICTTADYLQLAATGLVEAKFTPGWSQATDDYLVITRRDRNFARLADLRGKSVVFYRVGSGLGRHWMESMLAENGLGSVGDFFGASSEATKVSGAILPVFFGKAEVAVAKRQGWDTMKEMNPQLAVHLQILAHSPSLPDGVICFLRSNREHPFREDLLRGTAEMGNDPQGQQILLLFRTEKLLPFRPEHLDAVRALVAQATPAEVPSGPGADAAAASGRPKP